MAFPWFIVFQNSEQSCDDSWLSILRCLMNPNQKGLWSSGIKQNFSIPYLPSLPILNMSGELKKFQVKSLFYRRSHNEVKAEGEFILSLTSFTRMIQAWISWTRQNSSSCLLSLCSQHCWLTLSCAKCFPWMHIQDNVCCTKADLFSWGWNLRSRSL